ncbi:tyrosine-type recombinase/integrase [Lysinibacillus xylanilyticus]|uniref:tyrosine-type recombinase/integrase n=1 Tax=Lysinibacillus xylanilyticus TaxID=582475 RepID=UPI003801380C
MSTARNRIRENKSQQMGVIGNNVAEFKNFSIGHIVDEFLELKKSKSNNTYINYRSDIEYFFNHHFGKTYREVFYNEMNGEKGDLEALRVFFIGLSKEIDLSGKRKFSNGTVNRRQSSIKQLLKYMKARKVYIHDVGELGEILEQLPKDTNSIEYIPFERALEYAQWFKVKEEDRPIEKFLITMLAIDTGLRATELIELKWSQFTIDNNIVTMRGVGKGNKPWIEKISLDFYESLLQLKEINPNNGGKLFTLKYHSLPNMMKRARIALGDSERNYSFHSFKKCAVTNSYKVTGDILEAQRKGRHASLDTTRLYTEMEDYGITGLISLGGEIPTDLFKEVDHETLLKALKTMNKDFLYILNFKIEELIKIEDGKEGK